MGYGLAFQLFYMEGSVPGRWSMPFLPLTLVWTLWKKRVSLSGLHDTRVLFAPLNMFWNNHKWSGISIYSLLLDPWYRSLLHATVWRLDGFSAAKKTTFYSLSIWYLVSGVIMLKIALRWYFVFMIIQHPVLYKIGHTRYIMHPFLACERNFPT